MGLATGFPRQVTRNGETIVVDDIPASERFYAGGDTTVRGFVYERLGTPETIDPSGFPKGGHGLVVLNSELRTPVRGVLGAVAFIDAGNVFRTVNEMDLTELRAAVGFGLRYRSPVGPIRVDLGIKLDQEGASDGSERTADGSAYQPGTGILMRCSKSKEMTLLALYSFLSLSSIAARAEIIDRVLAILPGQIITQSDVNAALDLGLVESPQGGDRGSAEGLSAVIDRVLMLNEVRRVVPPEPSQAAIEARVQRIRQRFDSPAALSRVLVREGGIDESVLSAHAADDLRLASYLDERFSGASQPTDEEVRQAGEGSRQRPADERRRSLIAAWVSELRRRADVTVLP